MSNAIQIGGLRDFQRGLRDMDSALPRGLRLALNEAADVVVKEARPLVPRRSGRAAASIKAASTRTSVRVKAGGARVPYYAWLDWGGRTGRKKSIVRPFIKDEGRYLYHTYFKLKASGEFVDALQKALVNLASQNGIQVS